MKTEPNKDVLERMLQLLVGIYGKRTVLAALGADYDMNRDEWHFYGCDIYDEGMAPSKPAAGPCPPPWELTSDPEKMFGELDEQPKPASWQEHEMATATGKPSKVDAVMASASKKDTEYRKLAADDEGIRKANEPWAKVYGKNPAIGQGQPEWDAEEEIGTNRALGDGELPTGPTMPPEAARILMGWNGKVPLKKWLSEHPDFIFDRASHSFKEKPPVDDGAIPEPLASRIALYNNEREAQGYPRLTPHQTLIRLAELRLSLEPPHA